MFRKKALELGRFKRAPDRRQTEFCRWVTDFGVPRIVAALAHDPNLRITNQAVYEWLQGHAAHLSNAVAHLYTVSTSIDRRRIPECRVPTSALQPPFVLWRRCVWPEPV